MGMGQLDHIVASYVAERVEHGAQTGVSMPVVRDGESFLDALFAFARGGGHSLPALAFEKSRKTRLERCNKSRDGCHESS